MVHHGSVTGPGQQGFEVIMAGVWTIITLDKPWDEWPVDPAVVERWPVRLAEQYKGTPLHMDTGADQPLLRLAAVHPFNPWFRDHIAQLFPKIHVFEVICLPSLVWADFIRRAWRDVPPEKREDAPPDNDRAPGAYQADPATEHLALFSPEQDSAIFVDTMLRYACQRQATDLHFEPGESTVMIRIRQDGLLQPLAQVDQRTWPLVLGRLKVISQMDVTEQRLPQNGRMTFYDNLHGIDCRVATHPCLGGEKVAIRLLPRNRHVGSLDFLGFPEDQQNLLRHTIRRPDGMIVVCGPTGSGKTTTLYSLLAETDRETRNTMTLEDPVEYSIPGVIQTDLSSRHALSFGEGLRSLLRQDPDVILVGEIRDEETARMSLRAAMTGHQVLTTVHTASVAGLLGRFRDLGVPLTAHDAATLVSVVVHQRLVRIHCQHCTRKIPVDPAFGDASGLSGLEHDWQAVGCDRCQGTGYHGRTVLAETVSGEDLLARAATPGRTPGLRDAAVRCVASGKTGLAECVRVLGPWPGKSS
jgi:type II secretory ATPase GspE/PulE/Tfp pilus assembly ATPase PilB-like protein